MILKHWLLDEWYWNTDYWMNDTETLTTGWMILKHWLLDGWYWNTDYWMDDTETLTTGWMIPSGTNSPPVLVSIQWYNKNVDVKFSAHGAFLRFKFNWCLCCPVLITTEHSCKRSLYKVVNNIVFNSDSVVIFVFHFIIL
jgi:hypothetical protein